MPLSAPNRRRLLLRALESHGPMTEAQLVWLLGHLGVSEGAVRSARQRLVEDGLVRFAGKMLRVGKGRFAQLWEKCALKHLTHSGKRDRIGPHGDSSAMQISARRPHLSFLEVFSMTFRESFLVACEQNPRGTRGYTKQIYKARMADPRRPPCMRLWAKAQRKVVARYKAETGRTVSDFGDGTFIQWLIDNMPAILKLIMSIIAMFG